MSGFCAWLKAGVAAALFAAVLWFADPASVAASLDAADAHWLMAGLLLSVLSNIVSAQRWRQLVLGFGGRMGGVFATLVYFRAMALNALLPGAVVGGDLFRSLVARREGMDARSAGLTVLLDRVGGLWVLIAISVASAGYALHEAGVDAGDMDLPLRLSGLLAAAGLLVMPARVLPAVVARCPAAWRERIGRVPRMPSLYRRQVLSSVLVQLLSIAALAAAGRAIGLPLPAAVWIFVAAPVFVMAALPVSVGGWGSREAAAVATLALFGVAPAQATAVSVLYGLFGLVQAATGGLLFMQRSGAGRQPG
ncbi:lysylphosphatidylglycerol synthase transmembrane domain-containing protein [Methyloversatilis thermotolerans]|uniref:lysylphosphatidylglycerol synthase transmembrane domain-containing protein n=1 Tax=Methyloversatilis thermotolerans TaxID=1346290 RepID=UPI00037FF556|nr:lysylphosphatidylglycerol synthase transmembrane domain-containing protein [Methyloversatilis thermotolerans]